MNPTTNTEAGAVADVAAIARGLTKAQREWLTVKAVKWSFYHGDKGQWAAFGPSRTLKALADRSLVNFRTGRLLPLGLAVRQHLEQGATAL